MPSLSEALAVVGPNDLASRVVGGLFAILPFAPSWAPPANLRAVAAALDPDLADRIAAKAEVLARAPEVQSALATFDFLDKSDKGIAVFSGLRGAVKVAQGERAVALEMDPQQAADAGLKAAGLAWVTWKLYAGELAPVPSPGPADKLRALTSTTSGRALLLWYVAAELVLPFADNLVQGGTASITNLLDGQASEHAARLAAVAGPDAGEAAGMLRQMLGTIQETLGQAATYAAPLSAYVKRELPGILGTVDKATGVAATGVDVLATWRCIGNALVAEVVVARARVLVDAEVALEAEEARRQAEVAEGLRAEAAREAERVAEQARQAAEQARIEEAAQAARAAEAEVERLRESAQQERYSLDAAVPASSLAHSPVKVTRSADAQVPAKAGCGGCALLLALLPVVGSIVSWQLLA